MSFWKDLLVADTHPDFGWVPRHCLRRIMVFENQRNRRDVLDITGYRTDREENESPVSVAE